MLSRTVIRSLAFTSLLALGRPSGRSAAADHTDVPQLPPRRVILSVVALALLFVLWLSPVSPAAAPEMPTFGVGMSIRVDRPATDIPQELDRARELGAEVVRVDVNWSGFEQQPGTYTWWYVDLLDTLVNGARDRGMKVLLVPVFSPCWASSAPKAVAGDCSDLSFVAHPPKDTADYGRLVGYLADRYRGSLAGIEVWNEPNHPGFWPQDESAATRYVSLLETARAAIRTADPNLPVVAGVLSGSDVPFLERLYAAGMRGHYDVLSVHAYNEDRPPTALVPEQYSAVSFLQGLRAIHQARQSAGDDTPLWITETGWTTSAVRDQGAWLNGVDEDQQASYLAQALAMLRDPGYGLGFVDLVSVHNLRDSGTDPLRGDLHYGLLRDDLSPKPAFESVRATVEALRALPEDPAPPPPAGGPVAAQPPAGSAGGPVAAQPPAGSAGGPVAAQPPALPDLPPAPANLPPAPPGTPSSAAPPPPATTTAAKCRSKRRSKRRLRARRRAAARRIRERRASRRSAASGRRSGAARRTRAARPRAGAPCRLH